MTDERLRVIVEFEGKDAERKAKQFQKTLGGVGKETKKTDKDLAATGKTLIKVGVAFAGVTAAIKGVKKVWDFAEEGAQVLRLEQAGHQLAETYGADMDRIVDHVKAASLGTVSEIGIIASANKALMLGVADSAEEMAQLMEVASVRGRAMGLSTQQAFNDLVTGIGRASPLILDNLGIVTGGAKVYKDYAKSIDKSVEALTTAEKKTALFNKVIDDTRPLLEDLGGLTLDAAGAFEKFDAATEDAFNRLKEGVGEALAPTVDKMADMVIASNELVAAEKYLTSIGYDYVTMIGMQQLGYKDLGLKTETYADQVVELAERIKATTDGWMSGLLGVTSAVDDLEEETKSLTEAQYWEMAAEALMAGDTKLAQHYTDLAEGVENYAEQLQNVIGYLDALEGRKVSAEFILQTTFIQGGGGSGTTPFTLGPPGTGTSGFGPEEGFATWAEGIAAGGEFVGGEWVKKKQHGGPLGRDWTLVGDPGPQQELIYRGWVFDAKTTKKLLKGGLVPGTKRGVIAGTGGGGGPGAGGIVVTDPIYAWGPTQGTTWEEADAAGGASGTSAIVAGIMGGAAAIPPAQVVEAAVVASVAAAADIAGVQAKAMKDTVAAQRMDARRSEVILVKIADLISGLPTVEDTREIAEETQMTSGF